MPTPSGGGCSRSMARAPFADAHPRHARKVRNGTGVVLATRLTTPVYSRRRLLVASSRGAGRVTIASLRPRAWLGRNRQAGGRARSELMLRGTLAAIAREAATTTEETASMPEPLASSGAERASLSDRRSAREAWPAFVSGFRMSLGRTNAVKMIREYEGASEQRLPLEARLTARLQHPNIIPIHDRGARRLQRASGRHEARRGLALVEPDARHGYATNEVRSRRPARLEPRRACRPMPRPRVRA